VQELAETFSRAIAHLEQAPDDAPRVVFIFSASDNFFEEIAKFRAARAIWANIMRDRFGAKQEASLKLRLHVRTSSCSGTAEQTDSNIIRTSLHALAAVLGGAQSVDGESAKRILQVIAYETGVSDVPDPFGGSYYLERLTADIECSVRAAL
jgi:methylmalonyl-CoA mutase N-terminal domain/subunit